MQARLNASGNGEVMSGVLEFDGERLHPAMTGQLRMTRATRTLKAEHFGRVFDVQVATQLEQLERVASDAEAARAAAQTAAALKAGAAARAAARLAARAIAVGESVI
jgi:hypothetical protein